MSITNKTVSNVSESIAKELGNMGFLKNEKPPVASQVMTAIGKSVGYASFNAMIEAIKAVEKADEVKEIKRWMVSIYHRKHNELESQEPFSTQADAIHSVIERVSIWGNAQAVVDTTVINGVLQHLSVSAENDQTYATIELQIVSAPCVVESAADAKLAAILFDSNSDGLKAFVEIAISGQTSKEPARISISGHYKDDGNEFSGYVGVIGEDVGEDDDDVFYYFDGSTPIIGDHGDFVVTSFIDEHGVAHQSKKVHVVAWNSDGSGGFDWFPAALSADVAFDEEKGNCKAYASENWTAYRFDVLVDAALEGDDVTKVIDSELRFHCDKAEITYKYAAKENNITEILQHRISWYLRGDDVSSELDDCSVEHISKMIGEGYNQGELCVIGDDGDTEYHGWWSIKND